MFDKYWPTKNIAYSLLPCELKITRMKSFVAIMTTFFSLTTVIAQKQTISGYVRDAESNENLIGAAIVLKNGTSGTTTNVHGYFSFTVPIGDISLYVSYVGYEPGLIDIPLRQDTLVQVQLRSATTLDEVVVTDAKADPIHEITQMGSITIPVSDIKSLPAMLGEVDVLKVIQLMPGVKASEGSTGFYVRGGGPDQNLILLDGVPVYNVSHLFGFFSVFNADAINHVELVKGGFPARYGGRLSSVMDIRMKEGNMNEVKAEASVSVVSAKATVEGPIKRDKSSFILSARRTYVDLLAKPLLKSAFNGSNGTYYFYDVNAKLNFIINSRNRVYLSAYRGDDVASTRDNKSRFDTLQNAPIGESIIKRDTRSAYRLSWGNALAALRWNSILGPRLFGNLTTTYSRYNFRVFNSYAELSTPEPPNYLGDLLFEEENVSAIRDWATRLDFDFVPTPTHYFRFGANATWHRFAPGVYRYSNGRQRDLIPPETKAINGLEFSAYLEDEWRIGQRFNLNAGVHASGFFVEERMYKSLQPRISSRLLLTEHLSFKASFTTMAQFIHLLTNAGLGLPTDLWVPSTPNVKPQQGWQAALGLARSFKYQYEVSLETYYKEMSNLIEYRDGASFADRESDWQKKVVKGGKGESYGTELLVQKKVGRITGWAGYTLSWTNRKFEELNNGNWYPYKYDRRHDVSVALSHKWTDKIDFSFAWVFSSGNHISVPTAQFSYNSTFQVPYYGSFAKNYPVRNNYQMRAYHRLDVSVSFVKNKKHGQRKWTVGAYNAYNHRNPFYITLALDKNGVPRFQESALFPIIPAITYTFRLR